MSLSITFHHYILLYLSLLSPINRQVWWNISDDAKHLLKGLLTVNVEKRLTSTEALHHPFILTRAVNTEDEEDEEEDNGGVIKGVYSR